MYQKIKAKFKANPTIFYACSIVASWAGVGSLMNFRTLAINNGAAAAIIWAVFNSLACIFFGLFAEYIPTVRRIMQSKVMFYFIGFLTVFQTWTQMSGIYEIFGDTPIGTTGGTLIVYGTCLVFLFMLLKEGMIRNVLSDGFSWVVVYGLLAVVVIVIVFASVLYKRTFTVHELALTGVMAALSLVAYLFFRVPFYGGSSFHLGNTFTALTALLLDGVSGGLAGAIGLALADILAGDPGYAVTTFVLKFLIGITCGAVAHKVFKLRDLDRHSKGYLLKVIVAGGSGLLLNVITDPFLGYFRNIYIFGQEYTVAQALSKIAGGVTFVNSVASTICVVILYLALRPALERAGLLPKGKN